MGALMMDSAAELVPGAMAPELDGRRETVIDLTTNQPVGHVYVDVNHELLSTESHGFPQYTPVHHRDWRRC